LQRSVTLIRKLRCTRPNVSINEPLESVAESTADGNGVNKRQFRRVAWGRIEQAHYSSIVGSVATSRSPVPARLQTFKIPANDDLEQISTPFGWRLSVAILAARGIRVAAAALTGGVARRFCTSVPLSHPEIFWTVVSLPSGHCKSE